MLDQHALIRRLENADTEALVQLVMKPGEDEERVLRTYLGSNCYQRLHSLAVRREMMRSARAARSKHNVVVIPGMLGSELSMSTTHDIVERIWLNPRRIVAGQLARLQLDATGLRELDATCTVHATGIMKRYYGELILTLAESCNVHLFWYDWRKDLQIAAAQLQANISRWFAAGEQVHFVAHGVGGLVARAYAARFPEHWASGGRLIMLGTPNYGLFTAVQAFTGQLLTLRAVDQLDAWHDQRDFRRIVQSFPSLYQLLPSPLLLPEMEALYRAESYGPDLKVSQQHLDHARCFHKLLSGVADAKRMVCISGYNQPTFVGIHLEQLHLQARADRDWDDVHKAFPVGLEGDGNVPHRLGLLKTESGEAIPAYFVEASHGQLLVHPGVLGALHELLCEQEWQTIGQKHGLQTTLPTAGTGNRQQTRNEHTAQHRIEESWSSQKQQLDTLVQRISIRKSEPVERAYITAEERAIEEILTSGFLTGLPGRERSPAPEAPFAPPEIQINLLCGNIAEVDSTAIVGIPIDAIAVAHYLGSKPDGPMKALDFEIGKALQHSAKPLHEREEAAEELLLAQLTQRGAITGGLGQLFLLNDPRDVRDAQGRTLVVAGMGVPGRFGAPELTVLARELCWTLGRLGKRHLATVLIGSGTGNLSTDDAVMAWVRGLKFALTGVEKPERHALQEITFVEFDPSRVFKIDQALRKEQEKLRLGVQQAERTQKRMVIHYAPLSRDEHDFLANSAKTFVANQWYKSLQRQGEPSPTCITVEMKNRTYRFGALTNVASIPERAIPLDPELVMKANDELAAEANPARKIELGQFMERLLLPHDLRSQFSTDAPLVLMLDSTTARIHWELLAQVDPVRPTTLLGGDEEYKHNFWGTSRGLTRQLSTLFAPPPEPPAEQRILRVLVVADPAADNPLQGAEEEGIAVADLFERFNLVHASSKNRVEVVRLFGPREATRTAVLRHLMLHTYNVLHFAGHCAYNAKNVAASGWVFSNQELLSADELRRIDRIPQFIFSNACESGITPDRSERRSVELAPSFAEAFFERGVSNFVCTAWPVDDRAARDFALTLYAGLLGLDAGGAAGEKLLDAASYGVGELKPMYRAMRDARCAIADPPNDIRTWGAYQHYGNPYLRLFDPATMAQSES